MFLRVFSFYVSSSHPAYRVTCFYVSRGHPAYRMTCFYASRSHLAYRITCFYVFRSHPAYRLTCFYVSSGHPAYSITCFYVSRNHPVLTCPETIRHIDSFVGGVRTDPALTTISRAWLPVGVRNICVFSCFQFLRVVKPSGI